METNINENKLHNEIYPETFQFETYCDTDTKR